MRLYGLDSRSTHLQFIYCPSFVKFIFSQYWIQIIEGLDFHKELIDPELLV